MKLKKFYSLRTDFAIIGLTGRVGSGCSEIAKKLSDPNFINLISIEKNSESFKVENTKNYICYNFLNSEGNWSSFKIINYKDVLLLHLIHESNINNEVFSQYIEKFIEIMCQNGANNPNKKDWQNRLDQEDDSIFLDEIRLLLKNNEALFQEAKRFNKQSLNNNFIKPNELDDLYNFYFISFIDFSCKFYEKLNLYNVTKRTRLTHDLANNLRAFGSVKDTGTTSLEHIYTIAETLNRIIKSWKKKEGVTRIVIDSLKNSLELMYFKEKYSGFYMVATNKSYDDRKEYVKTRIVNNPDLIKIPLEERERYANDLLILDDNEYKTNDYKMGNFSTPDIENCIQKSDYHIYIDHKDNGEQYLKLDYQLIRLLALISQPGIITPTAIERSMQVAYNAKFNSGCISRQVGAVVTDENFSVKSIGWNDVPQGQTPCNLRNINDLVDNNTTDVFSDYEKSASFKALVVSKIPNNNEANLAGRNCSFCFKSFQNALEGEKNQVHTRSLHAEENAMLQITKYGGQGLKGGNLFTTASPCELCSKKAYQLGINNIYYIDPYPGIATSHTLKSGIISTSNPTLIMFQGAVGRVFHKLYEPFMAYKDEISILTGIDPKPSVELKIKNFIKNVDLQEKLIERLKGKTESEKEDFLEKSLGIMLEKTF